MCLLSQVLARYCRCVEIDVWDGEDDSDSESSESDTDNEAGDKPSRLDKLRNKLKKEVGVLKSHTNGTKHSTEDSNDGSHAKRTSPSYKREPRVLHGHTATKEVPFRTVCETIRDHAFKDK